MMTKGDEGEKAQGWELIALAKQRMKCTDKGKEKEKKQNREEKMAFAAIKYSHYKLQCIYVFFKTLHLAVIQ